MFTNKIFNIDELRNAINTIKIDYYSKKLNEINSKITEEIINSNNEKNIKNLLKEKNKIEKIIHTYKDIEKHIIEYELNKNLYEDELIKDLAEEENKKIEKEILDKMTILEELTFHKIENDEKSCFIEIKSGVGGIESNLFCEDLFKMYTQFLYKNRFSFEIYDIDYNNEGGINNCTINVKDEYSFSKFRFESGIHRVQRIPKTESKGRIHTSTALVVVIPEIEINQIKIDPKEIKIDVFRSGGPGGQSVNTTDSAVRITHIPTKIVVTCQNSKSQQQNKETAMKILISKIQDIQNTKNQEIKNKYKIIELDKERSSKIRTYNYPQSRITDHRINYTWFNLDEVMNGEISDIIYTVNKEIRKNLE